MNFILILLSAITILTTSFAAQAKGRHHHGAHSHGSGKLGIAFEGLKGRVELKIAAESIIGFEYEAKSEKDMATEKSQLEKLEQNISQIVVFDPAIKCTLSKDEVKIVRKKSKGKASKHADVEATFNVLCETSTLNKSIEFNFQKIFPRIKNVKVDIVVDSVQKTLEVNKDGIVLEVK